MFFGFRFYCKYFFHNIVAIYIFIQLTSCSVHSRQNITFRLSAFHTHGIRIPLSISYVTYTKKN